MTLINIFFIFFLNFCSIFCVAQFKNIQLNAFGHLEYSLDYQHQKINSYFSLGEHDIFVQAKITKRISFLGEVTVKYDHASSSKFGVNLQRALIKFNINNKHSVILGKIHTPVNYWNDVYHHGRVFYPVIARPVSFNYFMPMHLMGLRLQGQNIGKFNFGYDIAAGNSLNSSDVFEEGFSPSITLAFHFKPILGMRIGASFFYDYMEENGLGGHHSNVPAGNPYTGELYYYTSCFSLAVFQNNFEILNEFAYNVTVTDTLGTAHNFSNFIYIGYVVKEKHVPYLLFDFVDIAHNDVHSYPAEALKMGVGYKHIISYLINLKFQIVYQSTFQTFTNPIHHMNKIAFRMQLAYGF